MKQSAKIMKWWKVPIVQILGKVTKSSSARMPTQLNTRSPSEMDHCPKGHSRPPRKATGLYQPTNQLMRTEEVAGQSGWEKIAARALFSFDVLCYINKPQPWELCSSAFTTKFLWLTTLFSRHDPFDESLWSEN